MINSLSVATVNLILYTAQQKGASYEMLCQQAQLDTQLLKDPDARIPTSQVQLLWRVAIQLTGDKHLPLHLGECINPHAVGVVVYMMMHCATLGRALEKLCEYQELVCEGVLTSLKTKNNLCYLNLQVIDTSLVHPQYALESELSVYTHTLSTIIGKTLLVKEVHFTFEQPDNKAEHERIFQTDKLFFNSDFNGLVFDKDLLQLSVLNANPNLFSLFESHAIEYLQKIKKTDSLSNRVRQEILHRLTGEEPTLHHISRTLAMGIRSVQMKLKEEGTSFRQLLDEVRKEIAVKHLREPHISTTDIAYLLGFSEPSVFSRTFKKWTGFTPNTYRKSSQTSILLLSND